MTSFRPLARALATALVFVAACGDESASLSGPGEPASSASSGTAGSTTTGAQTGSGAGGSGAGDPTTSAGGSGAGGSGAGGSGSGGAPTCLAASRRCPITFTFADAGARAVELRGNFRPDGWESGVAMSLSDDVWSATVDVPYGLDVEYKFRVDGAWTLDPANPSHVSNGLGGQNSRLAAPTCDPYACTEEPALRFAVIGDFGGSILGAEEDANEAAVAELVASWEPAFVATVGDNNYPNGEAATIDQNIGQYYHAFIAPYAGRYGEGADENRFFPCPGNHDWNTGDLDGYLDFFSLPGNERYYDVAFGEVHLFFLDAEPNEVDGTAPDSVQGQWLEDALAASTAAHKLVFLHRPPYSSGLHGSSTNLRWPFAAWGATAVFAGHDHLYERCAPEDGISYIVDGIGGAEAYTFSSALPESVVRFAGGYGAVLVELSPDGQTLVLKAVTTEGRLVDHHQL